MIKEIAVSLKCTAITLTTHRWLSWVHMKLVGTVRFKIMLTLAVIESRCHVPYGGPHGTLFLGGKNCTVVDGERQIHFWCNTFDIWGLSIENVPVNIVVVYPKDNKIPSSFFIIPLSELHRVCCNWDSRCVPMQVGIWWVFRTTNLKASPVDLLGVTRTLAANRCFNRKSTNRWTK